MEEKKKCLLSQAIKYSVIFLGVLCFFMQSVTCDAYYQCQEDEDTFLAWYQEHKNDSNAVYILQGDLALTQGTEDNPIVLEGTGNITIDCGENVVIVGSKVILDNPNLTIKGSGMVTLLENSEDSHLVLKQGKAHFEGEEGGTIFCVNGRGRITAPKGNNRFSVSASGNRVMGIRYEGSENLYLSNLDIQVWGKEDSIGIHSYENDVTIENCNIQTNGDVEAIGVLGTKKVAIKNSHITAKGSHEQVITTSIRAGEEIEVDQESVLVPELLGMPSDIYDMEGQIFGESCTVLVGEKNIEEKLPKEVCIKVKNRRTNEKSEILLPVKWDTLQLDMSKPRAGVLQGRFALTENLNNYLNGERIVPKVSVIVAEKNQIFLLGWEIIGEVEKTTRIKMVMPYPYGAKELILQYSEDGEHFTTYSRDGEVNLLQIQGEYDKVTGIYGTLVEVPSAEAQVYLRMVVSEGSFYQGTSPVWILDFKKGAGGIPPEYSAGESGGDRGGQTLNPGEQTEESNIAVNSRKKPKKVLAGNKKEEEVVIDAIPVLEEKKEKAEYYAASKDANTLKEYQKEAGDTLPDTEIPDMEIPDTELPDTEILNQKEGIKKNFKIIMAVVIVGGTILIVAGINGYRKSRS